MRRTPSLRALPVRVLLVRALSSLLRYLLLPWCVSALFLAVVGTASALLGMLFMPLLMPLMMSIGDGIDGFGGFLLGVSLGWVALWMLFLRVLSTRRDSRPAVGDAPGLSIPDRERME